MKNQIILSEFIICHRDQVAICIKTDTFAKAHQQITVEVEKSEWSQQKLWIKSPFYAPVTNRKIRYSFGSHMYMALVDWGIRIGHMLFKGLLRTLGKVQLNTQAWDRCKGMYIICVYKGCYMHLNFSIIRVYFTMFTKA